MEPVDEFLGGKETQGEHEQKLYKYMYSSSVNEAMAQLVGRSRKVLNSSSSPVS